MKNKIRVYYCRFGHILGEDAITCYRCYTELENFIVDWKQDLLREQKLTNSMEKKIDEILTKISILFNK